MDKLYVSEMTYYPGEKDLPAGTVFTESQWVQAGGKSTDLAVHVEKGYITEFKQEVPETLVTEEKEVVKPEAPEAPEAPQGIWNFNAEDLEPLPIEALNTMYKQRAAEYDLSVRAYQDKDKLIKKMTSEV